MLTLDKPTEITKRRYNRITPLHDLMGSLVERSRYDRWRELLWSKVEGIHILEVGVGTGKSFPYYPAGTEITAVDLSEKILKRARDKANKQKVKVHLEQMNAQDLRFEDDTFGTVVASFVFCSVPDPIRDLMEIKRVCKPGGG